ncbi:sigma-70 family RNA polymerase sigma factor [Virgibacillus sp. L01]|uniref:sigma-70 family RNA polymerase sigma factor n=1 Tax=Virgibacillus sp. L01 TaxID=3457429 RepID=UPI003FD39E8D
MEQRDRDTDIIEKSREEIIYYIIDFYGEEIKRLIFTYVKNHAQTDDIFQEFLIKTYKKLSGFNSNSALKTWLYRIAINTCKDYLRSPIHRFLQYNESMKSIKKQKSAEQISLEKERQQTIIQTILSLPIKYREVITLMYYKHLSIKEISQSLGINESTVKTRIMRGKRKLRTKLEGYDVE